MQIFILGMHRSGTSATTRLINMMGAWFGPPMGKTELTVDNPKGFWEHPDVFKLNEAILASKGCSWNDLKRWKYEDTATVPDNLAPHIHRIVQTMDQKRPWVLKDPRLCLLLPAWRPKLAAPVAVIVHRDPVEIALSLQKRDGFPLEYGIALWEHYAVGLLRAAYDLPRVYVRHNELLSQPLSATAALHTQLAQLGISGLTMPAEHEIAGFIDPSLYRSRPAASGAPALTALQQELNDMVQGLRPTPENLRVSDASLAIMQKGLH